MPCDLLRTEVQYKLSLVLLIIKKHRIGKLAFGSLLKRKLEKVNTERLRPIVIGFIRLF